MLILVDDMGATDVGCYGSQFYKTPNIEKLAASWYAIHPGLSGLYRLLPLAGQRYPTGKYPARLHITDWIAGHNYPFARLRPPEWTKHLPLEERTIADALKPAGYKSASIGKWHLTPPSGDQTSFYPERQGFDENHGGTHRGQPPSYFSPYGIETLKDGPAGEYLTDREQSEASRFIQANKDRPFFVYLPHHTVHTPIQAKAEVIERYKKSADPHAPQHNAAYAAMIDSLDENVGRR